MITIYIRSVPTFEADEAVASSDFLKRRKIPEFGSVNLESAGSVLVFSSLQVLILVGLSVKDFP
jgi:hypothetical protein